MWRFFFDNSSQVLFSWCVKQTLVVTRSTYFCCFQFDWKKSPREQSRGKCFLPFCLSAVLRVLASASISHLNEANLWIKFSYASKNNFEAPASFPHSVWGQEWNTPQSCKWMFWPVSMKLISCFKPTLREWCLLSCRIISSDMMRARLHRSSGWKTRQSWCQS